MTDCRNLARRTKGWLGGYYDRLHQTAMRIALQIHVFEVGGGVMNPDTIERGITIAEYMKSENERVVAMFSSGAESTDSAEATDSEADAIVLKIRELGGEAKLRELQSIPKYRPKGGAATLDRKLQEMVKNHVLTVRRATANNGREVEFFGIATL